MNALSLIAGLILGAAVAALALAPWIKRLTARAGDLERDLVRVHADLGHERALAEERLKTLGDAQERLSDTFKALSAEALQAGMAQLTELARTQLQTAQAEAKGELEKRQQAVEHLVAPIKEGLGR